MEIMIWSVIIFSLILGVIVFHLKEEKKLFWGTLVVASTNLLFALLFSIAFNLYIGLVLFALLGLMILISCIGVKMNSKKYTWKISKPVGRELKKSMRWMLFTLFLFSQWVRTRHWWGDLKFLFFTKEGNAAIEEKDGWAIAPYFFFCFCSTLKWLPIPGY